MHLWSSQTVESSTLSRNYFHLRFKLNLVNPKTILFTLSMIISFVEAASLHTLLFYRYSEETEHDEKCQRIILGFLWF